MIDPAANVPLKSDFGKPWSYHYLIVVALLPLLLLFLSSRSPPGLPTDYPHEIIPFLRTLVSIPSPTGYEQAVFSYVNAWVKHHKVFKAQFSVSLPPLTPGLSERRNLLVLHPDAKVSDVKVVLSTHLDTVQGTSPTLEDPYVGGRGSVDAKGQAAALLFAARRMYDKRVAVLLLCGEESDHIGIKRAHEFGFSDDIALLNAEPTEGMLCTRQKGALAVQLNATGKSCHSGYPHLGDSAIHKMIDVLKLVIELEKEFEGLTINVGKIWGGTAANVLADSAGAVIACRIGDKAEPVLKRVKEVVAKQDGVTVVGSRWNDALNLHVPKLSGEMFNTTQVAYNTDVPYYQGKFSKAVIVGGASITVAHTDYERIHVDDVHGMVDTFGNVTEELLDT